MKHFIKYILVYAIVVMNCPGSSAIGVYVGGIMVDKKVKSLKEIKNQHVIRQTLDYSCGPAGLATIFNFYIGRSVTEQRILDILLQITDLEKVKRRKGFSLLDLKKFAEAVGYKATGYKMDIEYLKELDKPVLVPIKFKNYRHFVVVRGIRGDRIYYADPAMGNMTMKICRFIKIWQKGIGLVLEESDGKCPGNYDLQIKETDSVFADYVSLNSEISSGQIRTGVFPSEF